MQTPSVECFQKICARRDRWKKVALEQRKLLRENGIGVGKKKANNIFAEAARHKRLSEYYKQRLIEVQQQLAQLKTKHNAVIKECTVFKFKANAYKAYLGGEND